jgi:ketosteroid isomerase-like protein
VATIPEGGSEAKETNVQQRNTLREQNMALTRRFSEARANKEPEAIMGCLTEDVVWRYPGRNVHSREYRGKEEVAGFFRGLQDATGDDFSSEVGRILVDETVALVHELPRGTINGKSLEWETLLMFGLREGKIAEVKVFQHTQYELDAWWNS